MRRQALTIAQAVRAGRARVRDTPAEATVHGEALRKLVGEAAADVRLIEVPRQPSALDGDRDARPQG